MNKLFSVCCVAKGWSQKCFYVYCTLVVVAKYGAKGDAKFVISMLGAETVIDQAPMFALF